VGGAAVQELAFLADHWVLNTPVFGGPFPATGSALACFAVNGTDPRVYYLDPTGLVMELVWVGTQWALSPVTGLAKASPATAPDHLPRQYPDRRDRREGAAGIGTVSAAGGVPLKPEVGAALLELDQRNVAGEGRRPANVNRALPINFCGGPDEILAQLKQCREQIGAGVVDLSFQTPGSEHPDELMEALELFGKKLLPHIRDI
jgi:hypothetical protein